ncbi:MAG: ABC transporter ATP-binding protein [Acidobacteria bacterium]|nr:ABC transporter ATP-binding protein [Acidobacteriota bacterium]
MTAPAPLLGISDLSVAFDGVQVVHGLDLRLDRGESVALVGESGSGKSVTALSVLQLLSYPRASHPTGSILVDGEEVVGADEKDMRPLRGGRISMVFQEPMTSLNPLHTIRKQVEEVLAVHAGLSGPAARERTVELLELVGLQEARERLDSYPHQLSGGQRQRVMIAMAIAGDPDLLIADEPTTALDVTVQAQMLALIKELQERLGMALLLITHDLGIVRFMADRVYVMEQGRVVEDGPTAKVFERPRHAYTRKLIDAEPGSVSPIAEDEASPLVETKNLTVEFPLRGWPRKKTLVAVDDVCLSVRRGHSLGVVGESGSGKTTLAMAMVRLISSRGGIVFDGESIHELGFRQLKPLRRSMQIVFQDPYGSLSPRLSVEEIVSEGLAIHEPGMSAGERRDRVAEVLTEVGLDPEIGRRYPHEFSGGQRQRIAVARAMILRPRFVVLDEPTSSLDMTVQAQIVELLLDLQQRHGLTYLFISHDLKVVRALCDEILVMKDGRIVEQGPAAQLFEAPCEPYTQALMNAALDLGRTLPA